MDDKNFWLEQVMRKSKMKAREAIGVSEKNEYDKKN